MDILGTTLRVCVDDLEAAVLFYERLAGATALRVERGGVQVAAVGCFLLMSGPEAQLEVLRKVAATIAVKDDDETHRGLTGPGARIVEAQLEVRRKRAATLAVKDVDETHRVLTELGARIVAGPLATPGGRTLIAMHPDGVVYEYADRGGS